MSYDDLPTYNAVSNHSQAIEVSTGHPAVDAARDAAQRLTIRAKTVEHHKIDTARVADAVNTIIGIVLYSLSSLCSKSALPDEAIPIFERLCGVIGDIDSLLDEIRDMSVTRRNLNRSWTEHKLAEQERKLGQISADLNILNGRSGVIEGVRLQAEVKKTVPLTKQQLATVAGGAVWL